MSTLDAEFNGDVGGEDIDRVVALLLSAEPAATLLLSPQRFVSSWSLVLLLMDDFAGGIKECKDNGVADDVGVKMLDEDDGDTDVVVVEQELKVDVVHDGGMDIDDDAIVEAGLTACNGGGGNNAGILTVDACDGEGMLANCGDCFRLGLGELELTMLPTPGLVVPAS